MEAEVRAMRDQVYGVPSSDNNWSGCRDQWMLPENIEWLKAQIILQQHRTFVYTEEFSYKQYCAAFGIPGSKM
jgi:hypothetical protein